MKVNCSTCHHTMDVFESVFDAVARFASKFGTVAKFNCERCSDYSFNKRCWLEDETNYADFRTRQNTRRPKT